MAQQSETPTTPSQKNNKSVSKDSLIDYFKNHSRETVSYILLITGILLLFVDRFYGGVLVGIVGGIYFADAIIKYIKEWKASVTSKSNYQEVARHIIMVGLAIAFFISAPAIFLGAAVAIGIKQLFLGQNNVK